MSNQQAIDLFGWICLVGGILAALYIFWLWCLVAVEQEALIESQHD